jgi:hypothetical protein
MAGHETDVVPGDRSGHSGGIEIKLSASPYHLTSHRKDFPDVITISFPKT